MGGRGDPVQESQPPSPEQNIRGGSAFPANADDAVSSGADSDAASSTGTQDLDWSVIAGMNAESEQARH